MPQGNPYNLINPPAYYPYLPQAILSVKPDSHRHHPTPNAAQSPLPPMSVLLLLLSAPIFQKIATLLTHVRVAVYALVSPLVDQGLAAVVAGWDLGDEPGREKAMVCALAPIWFAFAFAFAFGWHVCLTVLAVSDSIEMGDDKEGGKD